MMLRVALVNLPFANVQMPSIGLTQLKFVTEQAHPDLVDVRVLNVNHDFSKYFGPKQYQEVVNDLLHHNAGLGDWFFRQAAFPAVADNSDEYFNRFYRRRNAASLLSREFIVEKRRGLPEFFARVIDAYGLRDADLVGLTSMFSQNVACFAFARALKETNPGIRVVMGGANCEYPMGIEILEHVGVIDQVFSGPGLISFPEFVGHVLRGDADAGPEIDGVFSRSRVFGADSPVAGSIGKDLDINVRIPLDYHDFIDSFQRFFPDAASGPMLTFETSRGCWWGEKSHCTFCGLNGLSMTYRSMAPARALEQFESLFAYASRGVTHFSCVDNILPKSYLREVLPHLNTPEGTSIFYEVKADLSESDVRTLANARVKSIQPGIEALATSTLKLMKKGTTPFQNVMLLKHCITYDVRPAWNLLVGFPGEKEDVFEKYTRDIPLLTHFEPPADVFTVCFDRFSPYFNEAESYGLDLHPYDFYAMTYPFPEPALSRLAFYFTDHNYAADYFVAVIEWLGEMKAALKLWKDRWAGGFAQRPLLEFRLEDGREVIFDSRGTEPKRYALTPDGLAVLKHLGSQSTLERLESVFESIPHNRLAHEVDQLRKHGLLFEEGDRLLSLVLSSASARGDDSIPASRAMSLVETAVS